MESVLPQTDRRSPFNVIVPPPDAKPIYHLVAYFKLWKHYVLALVAYLKDLVMAKEFELNLNLQLVGSVSFPGFKDLAYKCLLQVEQLTSPSAPPKGDSPFIPAAEQRPGLAKTQSALFLRNQTFAHHRLTSTLSLKSESSANSTKSAKPGKNASKPAPAVPLAKYAPKNDVQIDPTYFPPDSMFSGTPHALVNHHMSTYTAQARMCRELSTKIIPRLESLHRNLGLKIKEIRTLLKNESFANPAVVKEVSKTGAILSCFVLAVQKYSGPRPVLKKDQDPDEEKTDSADDPFLVKLRLDYQLKNQLIHENFAFALYVNLQSISKDLLNYVVKELSTAADRMIRGFNSEAVYALSVEQAVYNLGVTLKNKLYAADHEWSYFMSHNPNFVNTYESTATLPKKEMKRFADVVVPFANSLHSKCLRCGFMYKKQKLIKSYSSHFYLLTCNYLHEFKIETDEKTSDKKPSDKKTPEKKTVEKRKKVKGKVGGFVGHDDMPVKSYNLNDYSVSVKSESEFKFVLTKRSNTAQKFTFRCLTEADFTHWVTDLFDLLKFGSNHLKRFKLIEDKMAQRDQPPSEKPQHKEELQLKLKLINSDISMSSLQPQPSSLSGMFTPNIRTPPEGEKNPFDSTFSAASLQTPVIPLSSMSSSPNGAPTNPPSSSLSPNEVVANPVSPSPISPNLGSPNQMSPNQMSSNTILSGDPDSGADLEVQRAHEEYLQIQNEIMKQQEKLVALNLAANQSRPLLSRHLSTESMLTMIGDNGNGLLAFLNDNRDLMKEAHTENTSLELLPHVPTVLVLHHSN